MTDAEQLKPCPFCGDDDPEITGEGGWVWVACTTGSDCAGRGPDSDDEAEAIAAWNHRPNPSGDADMREKVARTFAEDVLEQAERLLVKPALHESPGMWRDRVRLAALLALTGNASTDRAGEALDAEKLKKIERALRKGINRLSGRSDSHTRDDVRFMREALAEVEAAALLNKDGGAG